MNLLSITAENYKTLSLLRVEGETDDDLIRRVVEYARCYMIIKGAEEARAHVISS